jgi:glycosyltransferase involved in cell wall biosynthesis
MKRVNVVCPGGGTGISLYNYNLLKALKKRFNVNIRVLTSRDYEFPGIKEFSSVVYLTNRFYSKYKKGFLKKLGTFFWVFYFYLKLFSRFFFSKEIIIFQRNFYFIDFIFNFIIRNNNKLVLIVHDVFPLNFVISKKIDTLFLKVSYKTYDRFVVHSEESKRELHEFFGIPLDRIYVIEHGIMMPHEINPNELKDFILKYQISKYKKVLLFFGVVRKNKGINVLMEAIKEINPNDYQLVIAGKGDEDITNYINDFISKNKLGDNIIFINRFIKEQEIPLLFNIADVSVLPYTFFHSQSGVLAQSISYLIPVVVTDVGAMKEIVSKYNIGLIAPAHNAKLLAERIKDVMYNENNYFYENLKKCRGDLLWENVVEKYGDLIEITNIEDV